MSSRTSITNARSQSNKTTKSTRRLGRRTFAGFMGAVAVAAFVAASPALALPKVGAARPAVHLIDGWDRDLDMSSFQRPVLLFYEDKDSAGQNDVLKNDLSDLQKSSNYRKSIAHVVVADTSAYDYWPAKGIAKGELRKWSNKLGIVVYSDFSANVRTALGLEKGKSNIVLYGANGEVLFAKAETLSPEERSALVDKMKSLL